MLIFVPKTVDNGSNTQGVALDVAHLSFMPD